MNDGSDSRAPFSVLVPVKNEAANLRDCLASVSFAKEIVVVDSESTDGTQAIAEAAGARVVQFVWNGQFPRKKNWALENIPWQHEWVLIVDADERITPGLQREIRKAICRPGVDGFYLNRRSWFLDGWMNHCGYFPNWNMRLFRHWHGRYEQAETGDNFSSGDSEAREHVLLHGQAEYLATPIEHYPYPDISAFLEKHKRYSVWEAAASEKLHKRTREKILRATPFGTAIERKRWLKTVAIKAPFRPSLRFLYHYVWAKGFLDGYRGWTLCRLLASYERMIMLRERELKKSTADPARFRNLV
jgi:glycosyltransferase involved in cell wall biosynthesis